MQRSNHRSIPRNWTSLYQRQAEIHFNRLDFSFQFHEDNCLAVFSIDNQVHIAKVHVSVDYYKKIPSISFLTKIRHPRINKLNKLDQEYFRSVWARHEGKLWVDKVADSLLELFNPEESNVFIPLKCRSASIEKLEKLRNKAIK